MKKTITALLAAILLLSVFSGCIKTTDTKPSEGQQQETGSSMVISKDDLHITDTLSEFNESIINGLSLFIDGNAVTTSPDFFRWEQGFILVRVAELSEILGYKFAWNDDSGDSGNYYLKKVINDVYGQLTMERRPDSASDNFYIGWDDGMYIFTRDEKKAYFAPYNSEYVSFSTDYPLRVVGGVAYLSLDMVRRAFHFQIRLDEEKGTLHFIREETSAENYKTQAKKWGYIKLESSGNSALYGYLVASKGENKNGLVTTYDKELTKFIYNEIIYLSETHQFLVSLYVPELKANVYGVVNTEGKEVLPCAYDEVAVFDRRADTYKVRVESSYGLIKNDGVIILNPEYDAIGTSTYSEQNIDASDNAEYVILGDCVSVKKNGKWGIYSLEGEQVLPLAYDSMGLVVYTQDEYGTIAINSYEMPSFDAVIVGNDGKFGAVNRQGSFVVPLKYDSIEYDYTQSKWYGVINEKKMMLE